MKKETPEKDFEYYCSFNVAMLLKEKGYDCFCSHVWAIDDYENPFLRLFDIQSPLLCTSNKYVTDSDDYSFVAPTISRANEWLRCNYNYYVTTEPYATTEGIMYLYKVWKLDHKNIMFEKVKEVTGFDTPHEAELNGIKLFLKKLLDKMGSRGLRAVKVEHFYDNESEVFNVLAMPEPPDHVDVTITIDPPKKSYGDTKLSIEEIEVAIASSREFHFLKNLVVFNVNGLSMTLPIHHECDVLVLSKSGYLTEIEIKRSWTDFLADFSKAHQHRSEYIKYFYYCVPLSMCDEVKKYLEENASKNDLYKDRGIITYDEDGYIQIKKVAKQYYNPKKLFLEQQLELARLGSMRVITLKKKIIKFQHNDKEYKDKQQEETSI